MDTNSEKSLIKTLKNLSSKHDPSSGHAKAHKITLTHLSWKDSPLNMTKKKNRPLIYYIPSSIWLFLLKFLTKINILVIFLSSFFASGLFKSLKQQIDKPYWNWDSDWDYDVTNASKIKSFSAIIKELIERTNYVKIDKKQERGTHQSTQ